jgi:prepilin-type N-terminal cleavage/methylation domain-containing protein
MRNKGFTVVELMVVLVAMVAIPVCLYGWIHNIVVIYHSSFDPLTAKVVLRVIGVFLAPLGVVMGYL